MLDGLGIARSGWYRHRVMKDHGLPHKRRPKAPELHQAVRSAQGYSPQAAKDFAREPEGEVRPIGTRSLSQDGLGNFHLNCAPRHSRSQSRLSVRWSFLSEQAGKAARPHAPAACPP